MRAVVPTNPAPTIVILPDKLRIVSYMKAQKKTAIEPKHFRDPVTDELIAELNWREDEEFGWTSETTYLFEKHNYPLPDDFIDLVRKQIG